MNLVLGCRAGIGCQAWHVEIDLNECVYVPLWQDLRGRAERLQVYLFGGTQLRNHCSSKPVASWANAVIPAKPAKP